MGAKKPEPDDRDLINPDDFRSIRSRIVLGKSSGGEEINNEDGRLRICEISGAELKLEVPRGYCARGERLKMRIDATGPALSLQFECEAEVKSVDRQETLTYRKKDREVLAGASPGDTVILVLREFEVEKWNAFCSIFDTRQAEIEKFFASVRGY